MSDPTLQATIAVAACPSTATTRPATIAICRWQSAARPIDGPVYCCFGCRLACEITGRSGAEGEARWTLVRLGMAIFLSINVMMFTMALWTQDLYDARAVGSGPLAASLADLFRYLCLVLSLPRAVAARSCRCLENALAIAAPRRGGGRSVDRLGSGRGLRLFGDLRRARRRSRLFRSRLRRAGHGHDRPLARGHRKVADDRRARRLGEAAARAGAGDRPRGATRDAAIGEIVRGDRLRVLAGERIAADGRVDRGLRERLRATIDRRKSPGDETPAATRCWAAA